MDDIEQRLRACFYVVFPDIHRDAIATVSQEAFPGWDSVAHVTLIAALSEEFGVEFDFEEFAGATTYNKMMAVVRRGVLNAR
jgi:acyl carrier protein